MKIIQRFFVIFLAGLLSTGVLFTSAQATNIPQDSTTVTYFEDGSCLVTRITYDSEVTGRSARQTRGTKHQDYYSTSHQLMWTFRVHGAFSYDGYRAEATDAEYSYDIYDSTWSYNYASAYCSGATATANGNFLFHYSPSSVTLTLTCSPTGVLS